MRVEGRLTVADPTRISFGMRLRLVIFPFRTDEDGTQVMSYAFEPVEPVEGNR
ncbi:hypothetical protein FAGKG844_1270001 [Frankia sp. AgKG'84/4]